MRIYNFLYCSFFQLINVFETNHNFAIRKAFFFNNTILLLNLLSIVAILTKWFLNYEINKIIIYILILAILVFTLLLSIKMEFKSKKAKHLKRRNRIFYIIFVLIYIHISCIFILIMFKLPESPFWILKSLN